MTPKRSPGAGDGWIADHDQAGLILVAELDPIVDAADRQLWRVLWATSGH
jgi:hypothetical protein